ncbi:hypothetical protein Hte_005905 [Hypoxylon texense]
MNPDKNHQPNRPIPFQISSMSTPIPTTNPLTNPLTNPPTIPPRSPGKRALETASTEELNAKKSNLDLLITKQRRNLKPTSSFDSEYLSQHMEILEMEISLHDCTAMIKYRGEVQLSRSTLTYDEWLHSSDMGLELGRKRSAMDLKKSVVESHAFRLSKRSQLVEPWARLFFGAASGLSLGDATARRRKKDEQSEMRAEMKEKYHETGELQNLPDHIWDPVCGNWFRSSMMHAAHLYPCKSAEHMDLIFGENSREDLMTAANGLFLCPDIEKALDQGYVAIVPDVELEPEAGLDLEADTTRRRELVKNWENTNPKEYKIIVLERSANLKKKLAPLFCNTQYNLKTLDDLHGRRLNFRTSFRPRARYVWWTYLNALANLSYRHKADNTIGISKEVELGNRYWGTRGRYAKKSQIQGFIDHIGHDISSVSSLSLLEHGIDEGDATSSTELVGVITNTTVDRAEANVREYAHDLSSESESESEIESEIESDE